MPTGADLPLLLPPRKGSVQEIAPEEREPTGVWGLVRRLTGSALSGDFLDPRGNIAEASREYLTTVGRDDPQRPGVNLTINNHNEAGTRALDILRERIARKRQALLANGELLPQPEGGQDCALADRKAPENPQ
jgi:hypothetical protein